MRKLATIRTIDKIEPIEGADKIELAHVGGWKVVVAKNVGHKQGDRIVYCEIDSFLPLEPEFEFLKKSSYKRTPNGKEGYRLKTIRLRGQISQGLIIPLSDAINIIKRRNGGVYSEMLEEGKDISRLLGIVKYVPPVPAQLQGTTKRYFPSFISKTDEERCLAGDTIINTEDGPMTIKKICETKYTGKVLSYNIIEDKDEFNNINNHSIQKNNNNWYEVELESGKTIKTTGNHRVWLEDLKCFREVKNLSGNEVVKIN